MQQGVTYIWNKEAVSKGLKIISDCRPELLCTFKNLLNSYHGKNRSEQYYDILAGNWLEHFMHVVYASWEQVRILPPVTDEEPVLELSATHEEYLNLIVDSKSYHRNLKLAVQRFIADEKPIAFLRKTKCTITNGTFPSNRFPFSLQAIKELLKGCLLRGYCKQPEVLICAPLFKCHLNEWLLTLWKWRQWVHWDDLVEYIALPVIYDHEWRYSRSRKVETSKDFSGVLKCLLPLCIPAVFMEGHNDFRARVLALKKPQPHIAYTANALHFNLIFKFLVAEWQEEGTMLLCHQHGGGYGVDRMHIYEEFETRVSDLFYSWGWRRADRKVQPLAVGIHRAKRSKHSQQILLLCTAYPQNAFRLHFKPMPGTIETMIHDTVDFVSIFAGQGNLLIRPSIKDYEWGFLDRLKQVSPNAKFDTGNSRPTSFKRFAQSRLVVHNYFDTSFLETFALNIPTICFFDPDTYEFRAEAKPFIEALERVGILHHTGKKAACFVRDKWVDIEAWWQQQDVQQARNAFCAKYANFSPDWAQQWETEFRRLLSLNNGKTS